MHSQPEHTDTTKPAEATATPTRTISTQRTKNDYSRSSACKLSIIADELHAMFEKDNELNKVFKIPALPGIGLPPRAGFDHNNDEVNGQQQRRNGTRVWNVMYDGIDFCDAMPQYLNLYVDNLPQDNPAVGDPKICLCGDMYLQVEIEDKTGNIRLLRRHLLKDPQQDVKEKIKEEMEEEEEKEAKRPRK